MWPRSAGCTWRSSTGARWRVSASSFCGGSATPPSCATASCGPRSSRWTAARPDSDRSIAFHRQAIRRHAVYVAWLVALSVLRDPRLLSALWRAVRLMFARRAEGHLGQDPLGEVLAIGVLPEYRTPEFVQRTALRIGDELIGYVAAYLRRRGLDRMRAVVDAPNRAALLFYHHLGGRFEPYERAGEPMIQVWLDIPRTPAPEAAPGTPVSRRGGG